MLSATAGQAAQGPAAGPTSAAEVIFLPEMLAVELPAEGMHEIAPTVSPLNILLESATAGSLQVTHDQSRPLPIGATEVTWTTWEGTPGRSRARATRSAHVYVFPFGMTPVGLSRNDRATAGNQSAKVVRDAGGGLHMAWLDGGRPGIGHRVMYRRAVQDPTAGSVVFLTAPIRVSDAASESGSSYVGLAASDTAIHFAWFGPRTTRYRRMVRRGAAWSFEPIRDTGATGTGYETSPSIAVRGDDGIHVLSNMGVYAVSANGGASWALDQMPRPAAIRVKNPAMAVDRMGNAHVVFTGQVRNAREWSNARPNAGYWELRYVRRRAAGGWEDPQNVLAAFPEWQDPKNELDMLSDWPHIAVDRSDNLHVVWHGSVHTRIFGRDEAFYIRRPPTGAGAWGAWNPPQSLHPVKQGKGDSYSFAPSIAVDPEGDQAVAVVFFDVGGRSRHIFDSEAVPLRDGVVAGPPMALSRMARTAAEAGRLEEAVSGWFPVAGPRLFRQANGRVWLDVLETAETPEPHRAPYYIVYQRREVTDLVRGPGRPR